jgi:hypothetical protein
MTRPSPTLINPRPPAALTGATLSLLLLCGLACWLTLPLGPAGEHASVPLWRWMAAALVGIFAFVLPRGPLESVAQKLRAPSPRKRAWIGVAIAVFAASYLALTAVHQDRDFFAKTHDECSYLLQTHMLAHGRLWMPSHPLADFFDSFYVLTKPVYASMYFPGTALMFVPALWLHVPIWLISISIAGAIVGLVYRLTAELVDGFSGILAAILLLSLSWFRMLSIMLMSQLPVLLLGLVMIWAWCRWRAGGRRWGWIVLIGACGGWAAITRPVDALCFAAAVDIAILLDLRAQPRGHFLKASIILAAAALPFLSIQAIQNVGITGHLLQTPFNLYAQRDLPGTAYGFTAPDPAAHVKSTAVQKQLLYEKWAKPYIAQHTPTRLAAAWWSSRLPLIADVTLPARPLLILLPLGLFACTGPRKRTLISTAAFFILLYIGYTFFLEHYAVVIAPAVVLAIVMAMGAIGRWHPRARSAVLGIVLAFACTSLWELNHSVNDEPFRSTWLRQLHDSTEKDAIVLFTFDVNPADPRLLEIISQEPVYNSDVLWPDDAPLIRAHDLGDRNIELFRYFASHAPDRMIYRFSRKTGDVQPLGRAIDLAKASPTP